MGNSGDLQLGDEFGQADVDGLGTTQLAIDIEAEGAVLLSTSDVVPFADSQAGPGRDIAGGGGALQLAVPVVVTAGVDDSEVLVGAVAQFQCPREIDGVVADALEHIQANGVVCGSGEGVLHGLDGQAHIAVFAKLPGGEDVVAVGLLLDGSLAGECAAIGAGVVHGLAALEGEAQAGLRQRLGHGHAYVGHFQSQDIDGEGGCLVVDGAVGFDTDCLRVRSDEEGVGQRVLVGTIGSREHFGFARECTSVGKRESDGSGYGVRIDELDVEDTLLLVNTCTGEDSAVGIFAEVGVDDLCSVQIASYALAFFLHSDGVLLSCLQLCFLVGQGRFHSVLALLHGVLGVAPSSEVQPAIVLRVLVVEDNEEAFGTSVLGGMNGHIYVGGRKPRVEHTGDVGCRGVCLAEGGIAECPVATLRGPLARHQVLGLEGGVAGSDAEVGEGGAGGPGAQSDAACRGVECRVVVLLAPSDILPADIIAEHPLHVVGRRAVAQRGVEADHIRAPGIVLFVGEDGGIAHHGDGLTVVLAPLHEHGFADGGVHVAPEAAVLRHGVLAHINVRGGLRLVVVASVLADEEVGCVVVVLVLQFHRFGDVVKVIAVGHQM